VPVTITVPPSLGETGADAMGSPSFKLSGSERVLPAMTVVAIRCPDRDCMASAVAMEYTPEEMPQVQTTELGPGRRWMLLDDRSGGRRRVHARLFAEDARTKSMVMCVTFLLGADAERLPEIRAACETMTL
jgi:hypothetical protein